MRDRTDPRFAIDVLRSRAGDKAFARGQGYHQDGQVEILTVEADRVLAHVAGAEVYRTLVTGRGEEIGGDCSCPAFADWGFCKHIVATALAANALGGDAEGQGVGQLSRIREHLARQGVESLVETIIGMAERDPALFRRLETAAAINDADDKTLLARLRKLVDKATRTGGYVHYREAPGWAGEVHAVLDSLDQLVLAGRGALALALAERAIDRIEHAIEQIDDSDGYCGELLHRCGEIHLAAVRATGPEPVRFARDLFAREMQDPYGAFDGAVTVYAEVLGERGLAEYRRLAAEEWTGLSRRSGPAPDRPDQAGDYRRLAGILDFFAEREGDVSARIALRAKDLSSQWNYRQLAEFCHAQGRRDEALRWAEEGLWLFEDGRQDVRLVSFTARLLSESGRNEDAEALLLRVFEKTPSLELYAQLRGCGARARDRAIEFLRQRAAGEPASGWSHPADLLVQVLMQEEDLDQAWAEVRRHGAALSVREVLARASEATRPREAVEVYAERVEQLVEGGGNPAYADAVQLIGRMAGLRSAADQAAYVAAVRGRFVRKRNFIRLLG